MEAVGDEFDLFLECQKMIVLSLKKNVITVLTVGKRA